MRIAILLLALLLIGTVEADPLFFPLSQHTMAKEIGPYADPVHRSYTFSQDDAQAVSWLKIWRDRKPHTVEWRWYSPNGRVYYRSFGVVPAIDGPVGDWGSCIWSSIGIKGYEVALMPGTWKVDVIVDFRKVTTEYFTIGGHQAPCCC
ncbi:MAG: hypothetical protein GKC10_06845 [Methanosarcinales archaeon]|nr:hypothetical protein [Methanosarcinales archaeon]